MSKLRIVLTASVLLLSLCLSSWAYSTVAKVSAGAFHTTVLMSDGTLWACGGNSNGQIGDATQIARNVPVRVTGISNVTDVAGGFSNTLAVRSDGTVWSWGFNFTERTSGGGVRGTYPSTPRQVASLSNGVAVAVGEYHFVVLKSDGTVWTWGCNDCGQLGNGTTIDSTTPAQVQGLTDVKAIAAGHASSYALKSDGTVWSWGENTGGFLPSAVQGLSDVVSISASDTYALALRSDGTVWSWGVNFDGRLGHSPTSGISVPQPVTGLSSVCSIVAGYYHALACKADGTVWAWGSNQYGKLGDDGFSGRSVPTQVAGVSDALMVAAGYQHSVAVQRSGAIKAWGYDNTGQLGDNTTLYRAVPYNVTGLSSVSTIDAGWSHVATVNSDGSVYTWGDNYRGQLGDGTKTDRPLPIRVPQLSGVTAVAAGAVQTAALKTDGTVWSWGNGGSLGDGTYMDGTIPVQAKGLTDVVAITGGGWHTVALKRDGTLWAWGSNNSGQIGDGTTENRLTPTKVTGISDVVFVTCGTHNTIAVRSDGTLWAWGYPELGILGNITPSPVQIPGISDIVKVACSPYRILLTKSDGSVWTWTYDNTTPVKVAGLNNIIDVAVGDGYAVALKSDGSVWTWLGNLHGVLGDGTTTARATPAVVPSLAGVVSIKSRGDYNVALKSDGTVWTWGRNGTGRLGDGCNDHSEVPVTMGVPSGSFVINNDDPFTRSRTVTLFFAAKPAINPIIEVQISNDGTFDTEPWEPVVQNRQWDLTNGDGQKTVWVRFKDTIGRISEVATDTIFYDTTLPPGTLTGSVTDKTTGTTIAGASVYFYKTQDKSGNPEHTATTDGLGRYSQLVSPGTWYVCATKADYDDPPYQTVTIASGASITANFVLSATPIAAIYKLDEATGTTASDSSGKGKNGALANGPTWTAGKLANCLSFDGIDDYVSIPDQRVCSSVTIAAWVNLSSLASDNTIFACDGAENGDVQLRILQNAGRVRFNIIGNTVADTESSYAFTTADLGKWRHVAIVYDATTSMVKFYINGRLDSSMLTVTRNASLTGGLRIGGWSGGRYFNGKIDEFHIYGKALSASEISEMVRSSSTLNVSQAKKLANGEFVTLSNKVVTYAPRNASSRRSTYQFYVEDTDRAAGLLVQTLSSSRDDLNVDAKATLMGLMRTVSYTGQRYLEVSTIPEPGTPTIVQPIGITTKSVQRDSTATGLLIKAVGKVVELSPDNDWFTLKDGYGFPTIVICETGIALSGFEAGDTVAVTGVVGRDIAFGDAPESVIFPRSVVKL